MCQAFQAISHSVLTAVTPKLVLFPPVLQTRHRLGITVSECQSLNLTSGLFFPALVLSKIPPAGCVDLGFLICVDGGCREDSQYGRRAADLRECHLAGQASVQPLGLATSLLVTAEPQRPGL